MTTVSTAIELERGDEMVEATVQGVMDGRELIEVEVLVDGRAVEVSEAEFQRATDRLCECLDDPDWGNPW